MVASSLPSSSSRFSRLCEVLLYLRASAAEPIFAAIVLYSPKVNDVEKWPLFTFYYGLLCHENLSNEKRVCSIITTGYYLNASRLLVFFHYSKAKAAFNYANGVWVFNRVCVQTASTKWGTLNPLEKRGLNEFETWRCYVLTRFELHHYSLFAYICALPPKLLKIY